MSMGLLQDRHGPLNVTKVPARHKGDLGLDYYCQPDCVVYQCYAVQEPCEVADRADKQKVKIKIDLEKFCTRETQLSALFRKVQIRRWVLTVPIHDSAQVNIHLAAKTEMVKGLGLSYVAEDFEAHIHDLQSFDTASRERRMLLRNSISLPSVAPSRREIHEWAEASNPLVSNLTHKLSKRVGRLELEEAVHEAIGWFLERDNALQALRENAPQLYEALAGVISRRATRLNFFGPPPCGTANDILKTEFEALTREFEKTVPNFNADSAQILALGTLAEWMLRCPLDFPPHSHSHVA